MIRHWAFFKQSDAPFGTFYPTYYIVAGYPSMRDAQAAEQAFTEAGVSAENVRAATGDFVINRLEAHRKAARWRQRMLHQDTGFAGLETRILEGDAELAHGLAMHIAAMNPRYLTPDDVPADFTAKEKEIALAQMSDKDKQKPAAIQEKMVSGRIHKILNEISLTGQPYVLDTNLAVGDVLAKAKARVLAFHRIAVGEGIEKKEEDFHAEVMKQAGLA